MFKYRTWLRTYAVDMRVKQEIRGMHEMINIACASLQSLQFIVGGFPRSDLCSLEQNPSICQKNLPESFNTPTIPTRLFTFS